MNAFRIEITSMTSSFRYPNLISGFQPTLEVPPISTVLGLINAAAGRYLDHSDLSLGYYFQFEIKSVDLETIYQIESTKSGQPTNNAKSNVINREFLFNNSLFLYLPSMELAEYFRKPVFQLLLGRSGDLATVKNIEELNLESVDNAEKLKGQLIPFKSALLPGQIQALPKYFSNTIPRRSIGVEPYSIISSSTSDFNTGISAYRDKSLGNNGIDIYFHELQFH